MLCSRIFLLLKDVIVKIDFRPLEKAENEEVYQMFQQIPAEENGFENSAAGLNREEFAAFCRRHVDYLQGIKLKPGFVPDTYYLLFIEGRPVGFTKLRHYLNDYLLEHGGHIGYGIQPCERGKGYGSLILQKVLEEVPQLGISRALLMIREYNRASRRVSEKNGGSLEKIAFDGEYNRCHYWIEVVHA